MDWLPIGAAGWRADAASLQGLGDGCEGRNAGTLDIDNHGALALALSDTVYEVERALELEIEAQDPA